MTDGGGGWPLTHPAQFHGEEGQLTLQPRPHTPLPTYQQSFHLRGGGGL